MLDPLVCVASKRTDLTSKFIKIAIFYPKVKKECSWISISL